MFTCIDHLNPYRNDWNLGHCRHFIRRLLTLICVVSATLSFFTYFWGTLLAVISSEAKNILLRHFYARSEEKVSLKENLDYRCMINKHIFFAQHMLFSLMLFYLQLRSKRGASETESLTPEQVRKHPRSSTSDARL